jgi:hypothetical protein
MNENSTDEPQDATPAPASGLTTPQQKAIGKKKARTAVEQAPAADVAWTCGATAKLEYCRIFPPIGVARVGNSPDEFFIGPEAPGVVPDAGGSYKDAKGRVKRQAARFRLCGFGSDGEVTELTLDHAEVASIRWSVSLANLKAEWYQFDGAASVAAILRGEEPLPRRNSEVAGEARRGLRIGPARVEVAGAAAELATLEGTFTAPPARETKTVHLGEARTDAAGRLLVLGGRGNQRRSGPTTR